MDNRAQREMNTYNAGELRRRTYQSVFQHTKGYYSQRNQALIRDLLAGIEARRVLEIGSTCWYDWLYLNALHPRELLCINISKVELEAGIERSKYTDLNIRFLVMDANHLEFEDEVFDVVIGGQILHHLNLEQALGEISRVLKPGGVMLFREPLDINPVAKIIRKATPFARTKDEKPFGCNDLRLIQKKFNAKFYYEQLLSVPFGFLSKILYKRPRNYLTKFAFNADLFIESRVAFLRPFFRAVLIYGEKKYRIDNSVL